MPKAKYELPLSSFELPTALRDMIEQGVGQAKDALERSKTAAAEASAAAGSVYSMASKSLDAVGDRALQVAKGHINASFDHAIALFSAKSFADAVELQTTFVRNQVESFTKDARDVGQLMQQMVSEAMAPAKAGFEKIVRFPG